MEVILAKEAGFCFGVRDAIKAAQQAAASNKNVFTHGPLIHNPQMVMDLEDMGIKAVDSVEELDEGTLVIRAHGVPDSVLKGAKSKGLNVIDATCPLVNALHILSKDLESKGYQILIFGQAKHPEIIGTAGNLKNPIIVETLDDAKKVLFTDKIAIVSQTTQMLESFEEICHELKNHCNELKIQNTICHPTKVKQKSAQDLSRKVDLMVVVGGKNSSNTIKLAKICSKNTETKHIEEASELRSEWFIGKDKVGITAGASTPDNIIDSVYQRIKDISQASNGIS